MEYVLIILSGGIVDDVVFFDNATTAVKALAKFVKYMDVDNYDAVVYGPEGVLANAKDFLNEHGQFTENNHLIQNVLNGFPKSLFLIGNPNEYLGFMMGAYDGQVGYESPVEVLCDFGQMRKDHGRYLVLYQAVPVKGPIAERAELVKYIDRYSIKNFDYDLVEEYLI